MASVYSDQLIVKADDVDVQGHVNNVTYLQWVQDVAVAHWLSVAPEEVLEKYSWVVTRHELDYRRPAFEGDRLGAKTWVGERTRITWDRFTEINREGDLLIEAKTVWCLVDRERMRPARITEQIVGLLS